MYPISNWRSQVLNTSTPHTQARKHHHISQINHGLKGLLEHSFSMQHPNFKSMWEKLTLISQVHHWLTKGTLVHVLSSETVLTLSTFYIISHMFGNRHWFLVSQIKNQVKGNVTRPFLLRKPCWPLLHISNFSSMFRNGLWPLLSLLELVSTCHWLWR